MADDAPEPLAEGPWRQAWKRLRRNRMAVFGMVVVVLMVGAAALAPWVVPFDPRESELWATALRPGARHLELRNEIVLLAGERPRETDVPHCVAQVLGDGREHALVVDVSEDVVRTLRLSVEGGVVRQIGEGGTRFDRIDPGPHDGFRVKDVGDIPAAPLEVGKPLPAGAPAGDERRIVMLEWRQRSPESRKSIEARFDGAGVARAVTIAGAPTSDPVRITAGSVLDARLDGVRHEHTHPLGTDLAGRDVLSRVIYGGRISLLVGLVATVVSLSIGVFYGAAAAYAGGRTDVFMMRVVDVLYALPYIFLVIVLLTVFERSLIMLFVALGVVQWLTPARVVRGQVLSLRRREFVEAAVTLGTSGPKILVRHLIPNTLGVVVVFTTLTIPAVIMEESFLSFIGLTVMYDGEPLDSWGALVENGRNAVGTGGDRWWLLVFPALAMSLTLFSLNFLGDGLRDALDPRQKGRG